jgi:transposase-like protein
MRKITIKGQKCPHCGTEESQTKRGKNASQTQRYWCKGCDKIYTLEPKKRVYSKEERQAAIKMYYSGVSGRGVAKYFGFNKANVYNWIKEAQKKRVACS